MFGPSTPEVRVRVDQDGAAVVPEQGFTDAFQVGRGAECDVEIPSGMASRVHAEVLFKEGDWFIRDLGSTNGTYRDGERIQRARLTGRTRLRIGEDGPVLQFAVAPATLEAPAAPSPAAPETPDGATEAPAARTERPDRSTEAPSKTKAPSKKDRFGSRSGDRTPAGRPGSSVTRYVQRYFDPNSNSSEPAGKHTQMIRQAYARVEKQQRQRYTWVIAAVLVLCAGVGVYAFIQYRQNQHLEQLADKVFYQSKEQDLQIAKLRQVVEETGDAGLSAQLDQLKKQRRRQAQQYEGYVKELGLRRDLSEEEKLIYRVARIFNESEFEIPAGFIRNVRQEIQQYWLTPAGKRRFKSDIRRAEENGYTSYVVQAMRAHGLPPEFFYLALQESNFDTEAVGPKTRWGIAKGMWQFIPSTGRRYGLTIGPRADVRAVDLQDDRHHFKPATTAAASYLQDIYSELAQASGLLVMASYNWGEHRVVSKLERLFKGIPEDPSDRNYWRFLTEYQDRMPEQTKDYVLKIFSAAVIGQNPRAFGIDLDNPLRKYMQAPQMQRSSHTPGVSNQDGRVRSIASAPLEGFPEGFSDSGSSFDSGSSSDSEMTQ